MGSDSQDGQRQETAGSVHGFPRVQCALDEKKQMAVGVTHLLWERGASRRNLRCPREPRRMESPMARPSWGELGAWQLLSPKGDG
jgi:hypothetical protein